MKIHIDLPWGGTFHIEREKRESDGGFSAVVFISIVAIAVIFVALVVKG